MSDNPSTTHSAPIFRDACDTQRAERALSRWLLGLRQSVLACSLVSASACASSERAASVATSAAERARRTELSRVQECTRFNDRRLFGIHPEVAYEYLSMRRAAAPGLGAIDTHSSTASLTPAVEVLSERGRACGRSAPPECLQRLDAVDAELPNEPGEWFVGTVAGEVRVIPFSRILDLFGAIDTPVEALWLVTLAGYEVHGCIAERTKATANGFEVMAERVQTSCDTGPDEVTRWTDFVLEVRADGAIETRSEQSYAEACPPPRPMEGRKPAGLANVEPGEAASLGEHFARAAQHEAASVAAFAQLCVELKRLDAPAALVRGAARAACDELRHAQVMSALARAFGGAAAPAVVHPHAPRSLFAIALDNAVEGCVHEIYAAARIAHQASVAHPALRGALSSIAADELRHAAWSWQLAHWAEPRLRRSERELAAHARSTAIDRLHAEVQAPAGAWARAAGLPDVATSRALAAALRTLSNA